MLFEQFLPAETTGRPAAYLLVRIMVGSVFLSEGIQKFLFSDALGVGRFVRIGIPSPGISAPFVGIVEIACGLLVLAGLFTRFASLLLMVNILVAIATTKIPILIGGCFPRAGTRLRLAARPPADAGRSSAAGRFPRSSPRQGSTTG